MFSTKDPRDLFASEWTWKLTLLNLGCLVPIYMLLQVWNILLLFFPIILLALIMVCLFVLTCVVGWEHGFVCFLFCLGMVCLGLFCSGCVLEFERRDLDLGCSTCEWSIFLTPYL